MSNLVALDIHDERLTVVSAETSEQGSIIIQAIEDLPLSDIQQSEKFLNENIDASFAVLSGKHVLYNQAVLPFRDPKKIQQVTPLQIQDSVPFDISNFVIDNIVVGQVPDDGFSILSSYLPEEELAHTLQLFSFIGADPKIITTKASAVSTLHLFYPDQLQGTYAIIALGNNSCSMALFIDNRPTVLRDFETKGSYVNLKIALTRAEREFGKIIDTIYYIGREQHKHRLEKLLGKSAYLLDLSSSVETAASNGISINDTPWALGLFANELFKKKKDRIELIDFRQGKFAYKPTLGNLIDAVRSEAFYLILAVVLLFVWFGTRFFTVHSTLGDINNAIEKTLNASLPDEKAPYGNEHEFLGAKVAELEEQLRGIGSLSSLSPLDSLRELSASVGPNIDIEIDSMSIGHSRLSFQGAAGDVPAVGRLSTLLEQKKDRFCEVNVAPKEKIPGSSRVKFTADIKLCE